MTTTVSPDFAQKQERYTPARRFMREFLLRTLAFHILVTVDEQGVEHIPPSGPTLLMMNHIAGIDPAVVVGVARPRFAVPMSKIENFSVPGVNILMKLWGIYPVHRGEVDRAALNNTVDLLKYGNLVLMAPEGTRHPALSEAKDGITYVALKADAMIVPVGVDGTPDLMRNLKRLRRTPVTVKFGKAFRFRKDGRDHIPRPELRQMTHEAMYQLASVLPEQRRGFYRDLSQATTKTLAFV